MKDMELYDCLVVGAGPAGSLAALTLSRLGRRVLLLEKYRLPRHKCCAGGVPAKAITLCDFDISSIPHSPVRSAVFSWASERGLELSEEEILGWVVDRSQFDALLARMAESAGACLCEGQEAIGLSQERNEVRVSGKNTRWRARTAIIADGASGRVSRALGFGSSSRGFGIECRLEVPEEILGRFQDSLFFDFGRIKGGYGWIFPCERFLNLGGACPPSRASRLRSWLADYAEAEGLREWFEQARITGAFLNFPTRRWNLISGNCLAVGDAAALVDRLTGEGIYQALLSGSLAAQAVDGYLAGQPLAVYSTRLNDKLKRHLMWSVRPSYLMQYSPRVIYRRVVTNPEKAAKMLLVGKGEAQYQDLFGGN